MTNREVNLLLPNEKPLPFTQRWSASTIGRVSTSTLRSYTMMSPKRTTPAPLIASLSSICGAVSAGRSADFHPNGLAAGSKRPGSCARQMAERQTSVLFEIGWMNGSPVPREIRWAGADDLCQIGDVASDE